MKIRYIAIYSIIFWLVSFDNSAIGSENGMSHDIARVIENVSSSRLSETIIHLQELGNRTTYDKQWETARWLQGQFKTNGVQVEIQSYELSGKIWPTVVASIDGRNLEKQVVMLIAHLDSVSNSSDIIAPGADDNGSGVAAVLEIARLLKGVALKRSVVFCVFSNEENDTKGSKAFVEKGKNNGLTEIQAVINLDSLGYNLPDRLFYIAPLKVQHPLKYKAKALYRMTKDYFLGLLEGYDVIKVAGRPPNGDLVKVTSAIIRKYSDLTIKEMVKEDCG